jgi:hypothetical protein
MVMLPRLVVADGGAEEGRRDDDRCARDESERTLS